MTPSAERLAQSILGGSIRALARGLTWAEEAGEKAELLSELLYAHTGKAHVVGITGSPGSGKSTLARALARAARRRGLGVGILAVDPSSPFSGGSILGDRIRMNDLTGDPGIFIRSMATHGAPGGLCRAAGDAVDLMDAFGKEFVIVETVGVGQDEVDVMNLAATVVVVSVPGLGDDIQTLKAGILEIADIHVVNKADREGADRVLADLRSMLTVHSTQEKIWIPPILACVASREEGIEPLLDATHTHEANLRETGEREMRRCRIAGSRVLRIAEGLLKQEVRHMGEHPEQMFQRVAQRELGPHACARTLFAGSARHIE